jgi:serine/threonine-protein kinase
MTNLDGMNPDVTRGSAPVVGETIGPYRIIRQLGHGTTSRVFEVEHTRIGRRAALKVVHRTGIVPAVVDRLFVEAQAVNLIKHPHVVEISDILVPAADQPDHALVMELLDGRSLADILAIDGALPPERYLPIMAQICAGLAAVHRAGFVHRDLKPENVFLIQRDGDRDFVKLLDFGLVKALRGDLLGAGTATVEGTFMGSPAYASPEQSAGKAVDQRSDIYALGVMLHELVTGKLPFLCEHVADLLMKQITAPPPRLSDELLATDIGRAMDAIIQSCLVKDPAERALSAAQLGEMFGRLVAGDHAIPDGLPRRRRLVWHGGARRRRTLAIAPVLALAAFGLFAIRHRGGAAPLPAAPAFPAPLAAAPAPAATADAKVTPTPTPTPTPALAPAQSNDEPLARPEAPRPRRAARTPPRLSKATTLDPYR